LVSRHHPPFISFPYSTLFRSAPAWVTSRVSSSPYVGWAPMPPRYIWRSGVAMWIGSVPPLPYVFVPSAYFFYPSVYSYVIYDPRSEEHTSELQSRENLVCRPL